MVEKLRTFFEFDEDQEHKVAVAFYRKMNCCPQDDRHSYVEGARFENARTREVVEAMIECVQALGGCSDGNCRFISRRTGGMHTNGGCHCVDNAKHAIANLREKLGVMG